MPGISFISGYDPVTGEPVIWRSNPEAERARDSQYSDRRSRKRGDLREHMDDKLKELTQDPHAGMFWTLEDYLDVVCGQYGYKLVGWPQHVTFANLSRIRGGVDRLSHLLRLWETGRMRFVPLTDDEHHLLRTDAERLAPAPVELCARSTSRSIRRDCGERRKPKRLPNGRVVDGPKTPVRVPESDEEDPIED